MESDKRMHTPLDRLQHRVNYRFANLGLLQEALTHTSYRNEHPQEVPADNERLEFLGDAVLQLAVTTYLYHRQPHAAEGLLTLQRAEIVSETALAAIARSLHLGEALRLGRGEQRSGGADKDSILSDAMEALLGAIYLDGGYQTVATLIEQLLDAAPCGTESGHERTDYKTRLQEWSQARHRQLPVYVQTAAEGPDHCRVYHWQVRLDGDVLGQGEGPSKKSAQQGAARAALLALGVEL